MTTVAIEEHVRLVKVCGDEVVAIVSEDGRRHLVLLAPGEEHCSSCVRQPCLHVAIALESLTKEEKILKTRRLRRDEWGNVVELVERLAAGENPRPRLDAERLSEAEAVELAELAEQMRFGEIDRINAKFWKLVAKASGLEPDHFERRAEQAKAARKAAEREAKERRLNLSRSEEGGFFRAAAAALHGEDCWADDIATLAMVLSQFASGRPFSGVSYFTGTGREAALVIDWNRGGLLGPVDGQGCLDNSKSRLEFLHEEGWLVCSGRGPVREIRLGPRLLDALDDVPVGEEVVA